MSLKSLGQLQPIARSGFHLTDTSSFFIMQASEHKNTREAVLRVVCSKLLNKSGRKWEGKPQHMAHKRETYSENDKGY
jgi:hypothetical protein